MSEIERAYHDMMCGSIYDCIKWIRLTSGAEAMPYVANLIESEINIRNDEIAALKETNAATLRALVACREVAHGYAEKADRLDDEIAALKSCLAFFASVIKSGEPWTETCQKQYDEARLAALKK